MKNEINWLKSMQQTFEYYKVNPNTWKDEKQISKVLRSTINRDSDTETLESANIDASESIGECYVRVYLKVIQNGFIHKEPIGTFLVQTPSSSFDGRSRMISMDAYSPLLELKESSPPLGYSIMKDENIMAISYNLTSSYTRAPVAKTDSDSKLFYDFVADVNDTWLSFLYDLIANAKYKFDLDALGRILFSPKQDTASLQPVWTYNDDNSSILYPDFSLNHDLYGIPNVVEVIYSNGNSYYYAKAINEDENSPTSIPSRGREIIHRVTDPDLIGTPTENQIEEYAQRLLKELSSIEYTITYTHGYCPVRLGDCVRLNYSRAGLSNIKAKVISQSIKCEPGCPVTEKAVFTTKLWGG